MSSALLDVLFPDSCPGCDGPAGDGPLGFCAACAAAAPLRLPRALPHPPPGVESAFVLGDYDGPLGAAVRRAKYRPDPLLLSALGRALARAAAGRLPAAGAVVAVPSPLLRRARRGLCPAEELARPVARALRRPLLRPLRRRGGPAQAGRSARERRRADLGFRARRRWVPPAVLLVDDVVTTGMTAEACAALLRGLGAKRVHLLCACAARAPADVPIS